MHIRTHMLCLVALGSTGVAQDPEPQTPVQRPTRTIGVRIKQLTRLHGQMENALSGIGFVTGLNGTGAGDIASRRMASNYINRASNQGLKILETELTTGNFAMVTVTAKLPPFSLAGQTVEVFVQALGDATSIADGYLQPTELVFFDGAESITYVTASGTVGVDDGFGVAGSNAQTSRNNPTTGLIAKGGTIVAGIKPEYRNRDGNLELMLLRPNVSNAIKIAEAIDRVLNPAGVDCIVRDQSLLEVVLPEHMKNDDTAMRIIAETGDIRVEVEQPANVIIRQATGSIIAGPGVEISPCVIALSSMTISVINDDEVVQPLPGFNQGETAIVGRTRIEVSTDDSGLKPLPGGGATVGELLDNLKALGLPPRQLIEVFKELDAAGYLHADLIVR